MKVCNKHRLISAWKRYCEHMGIDSLGPQEQRAFHGTFMAGANVVLGSLALSEGNITEVFNGLTDEMNGFVNEVILEDSPEGVKH